LAARDAEGAEAGFTLIELMVVLLIMAILLATAIPVFLGTRASAQNRSIQVTLRDGLDSAQTYYEQSQSWSAPAPPATLADKLTNNEPELKFVASPGTCSDQNCIVFLVGDAATTGDNQQIVMSGYVTADNCWYMLDNGVTPGGAATISPSTANKAGVYWAVKGNQSSCDINPGNLSGYTWSQDPNQAPTN
jgi:type IV pilus assembly protein PilA